MRIHLNSHELVRNPDLLSQVKKLLCDDILFLRESYPNFENWLYGKVLPGIETGERSILIETRSNEVAAFMILKHDSYEKKLCTLRVRPAYESRGMGVRLFDRAFEILKTERPLLSVSENSFSKFEPLFKHFGFSHEATYQDRYIRNLCEHSYNGLLEEQQPVSKHNGYASLYSNLLAVMQ